MRQADHVDRPGLVQHYMDKVAGAIGREQSPLHDRGAPDADKVIVTTGSGAETAEETINDSTPMGQARL